MKRIAFLILAFAVLLSTAACDGTYAQIDLNNPVSIPENGIIEKDVLDKVRADNAIATFVGESNGTEYRWIIFGRDITNAKDVNLCVNVEMTDKGVALVFSETEEYGFTALLSVYLNEKWSANSATAYCGEAVIGSVSITGSNTSILNVPVDKVIERCEIIPDTSESDETDISEALPENSLPEETVTEPDDVSADTSDTSAPDDTDSKSDSSETNEESDTVSRPLSSGNETSQDQYKTDPVPEGMPLPVEPENQEINKEKTYTCTFSIECSAILNNLSDLDPDKLELIPSNGVILEPTEVTFYEGESVFDVLKRVCKENNIHLEFSWTPIYNSAYIEGIYNLYEFDCGALSGWMYRVDGGWYSNYGCSRYQLSDGETVEWRYTCDLGRDVGEDRLGQS